MGITRERVEISKDEMSKVNIKVAEACLEHLVTLHDEFVSNVKSMAKTYKTEFALLGVTVIAGLLVSPIVKDDDKECGDYVQSAMMGTKERMGELLVACADKLQEKG